MSSTIDDDFDWAAAVAEIDKACSRHVTQENGGSEPSSSQSRAKHQKTLDSFVRGGVGKRSNVSKAPAQHGTGGALDSSRQGVGNQPSTLTENRFREASSDGEQASSSGCRLPLDYEAAKVWIYPANVPRRSYQFNITESALFSNTLVCLPTGLGKTLIAAVVMYNYFRWFPTGKIVFAAPSRPLVVQQIESCHKVTGIPQSMTIDMTGQMNPQIRAEHWQSKRVFFVTPQVLEKDIQSGRAATKQIVCLVVDEAHRATGNYSYCVVIRELLAAKVEPRILALTATPGSKQITVQAVVDNLQISGLEYRDEHDPDVSQYTHNREIEVIEVPMNAESIQVKDVFTEVLQPIVHRLCYLGVFYSREIARLTPYEFLTARDKFRQAPPQVLQQSKYQEVETYFGLAITLFHVFKLLLTHGMRPAYEMLRQKVENGVLRRLAKNEKLLQVQELMKQSIGYGAPSPKLEKVVDIIDDHFSVHDAANTRVIIFTNFRESVKDIMEKLTAACESVKAMEFIGQSSGKTSKGQTQKTQQAVLQRFRGGCYNTIVATSIAEEGLDIMEVDLVICFDANISPLRMIQRMGRTGRKRDGRVVVLASGGSEIQGYRTKQTKSKALGKHMLNGGVKSFNFHASHHMIPHSLRTTVQFVELAIEDFIPRGRKAKEKDMTAAAGPRKLTERELEIVKLVKEIPDLDTRMKGGPEDPVNRFFSCPVYKVKHSKRSLLIMDCLQTLGVPVQLTNEDPISRDNITPPSPIEHPVENNVPLPVNEIQVPTSPVCEILSGIDRKTKLATEAAHQHRPVPLSEQPCGDYGQTDKLQGAGFHGCRKRSEVLSVTQSGSVLIASPPSLPLSNKVEVRSLPKPSDDCVLLRVNSEALQHTETEPNTKTEQNEPSDCSPIPSPRANHRSDHATPVCQFAMGGDTIERIATTPDGKVVDSCSKEPGLQKDVIQARALRFEEDLSPRLAEFANHGVVPGSPRLVDFANDWVVPDTPPKERTPISGKEIVSPSRGAGFTEGRSCLPSDGQMDVPPIRSTLNSQKKPPRNSISHLSVSSTRAEKKALFEKRRSPQQTMGSARVSAIAKPNGDFSPLQPRNLTHMGAGPLTFDSIRTERLALRDRTIPGVNNYNIFSKLDNDSNSFSEVEESRQSVGDHSGTKIRSPLQVLSSNRSCEEDWQIKEAEAPGSVQKPRQLKRLRRACENVPISSEQRSSKRSLNRSVQQQVRSNVKHSNLDREKNRRKLAAREFIDEEAEVSSEDVDDESSGQEDCVDEEGSSLEGFIDTAATQQLNGSVDMMNIYRKSLLTQSPQINLQHGIATPSSDATPSSIEPSSASRGLEDELSDFGTVPSVKKSSVFRPQNTVQVTRNGDLAMDSANDGEKSREAVAPETAVAAVSKGSEDQDRRKADIRKRKLSFQSSSSYEDDLFAGVDLDALEAEATQISRMRTQGQVVSSIAPRESSREQVVARPSSVPSRAPKDVEFEFLPSFDLGLDT